MLHLFSIRKLDMQQKGRPEVRQIDKAVLDMI